MDRIYGLENGAEAYISKPFHPTHLIKQIEQTLNNRRLLWDWYSSDKTNKKEENKIQLNSNDIEFLDKLYKFFEENISDEAIDIEALIAPFHLGRTRFFTKVKSLTGMSPYELFKNYRITKAGKMLASGEYNVNEVFYLSGFKSRTHFQRLFKEKFGISPGKYIKSNKE